MALSEAYRMRDGIAETANFDGYRVPRNTRPPRLHVELLDSNQPRSGAGQAAFASVAAAIVNAMASLDGRRVRRLPVA